MNSGRRLGQQGSGVSAEPLGGPSSKQLNVKSNRGEPVWAGDVERDVWLLQRVKCNNF